MLRFLGLGIIILPIVEIAIFIKVGQWIGLLPTLALIIGAALLGGFLFRQQGFSTLARMRADLATGRMPARAMADAALLGLAAVLLVLPGFLSDFVALALLLPPVRSAIYAGLASRVTVVSTTGYGSGYRQSPEDPRLRRPGTIDLDEDDYRRD